MTRNEPRRSSPCPKVLVVDDEPDIRELLDLTLARMDVPLLSQVTGLWQLRIRRHFRPDIFQSLSSGLLKRYGDAMGLTVEQLKKVE